MERLFSPCTRFHDLAESIDRLGLREFRRGLEPTLQELNLDVSTQELLSAERAFTYADVYDMLGNLLTLAWLTPHVAVIRNDAAVRNYWNQLNGSRRFYFIADGKKIDVLARTPEHLLQICDVILRLLAASVGVHSVKLNGTNCRDELINAPSLACLMEQCQSLKTLSLHNIKTLDEDQIRVLGAFSRPGLDIELQHCTLTSAGTIALVEVLTRNQGPTKLAYCSIDISILANGLRGNSRLKSFIPRISHNNEDGNREILAIAGALNKNKGLVSLDLYHDFAMSLETWYAVCDSLETHPTLEILYLRSRQASLYPAVPRIQALVTMLRVSTSIHTIQVPHCYREHDLFRGSVVPYLETNGLRLRVREIQKTRPIAYRTKVLGRALIAVRSDPNRFWMLLSGNAEVAFPSRTTTVATNERVR
jgi:hypothetical protein